MDYNMKTRKKALLLAIFVLVALAVSDEFLISNILENYSSTNSNSSIVNVVNGVSGVVTIKDPSLNKILTINIDYYALASGSGVIVTNNGYIITAFHVISNPQTLLNQHKLKKMTSNDINQYVEQAAVYEYLHYNPQLVNELLNNKSTANSQTQNTFLVTNSLTQKNLIRVDSAKQVIKVNIPPSNNLISNYLNAQLIDVGNANNDEDVALLKVNYNKKLFSLNFSSNNPFLGEKVHIFGYPVNTNGNQNSIKLASTSGSIINKVVNNQGIVYYETNASTFKGYSGGPALDNKNRILGILIYEIQTRRNFGSQINPDYSVFLSSNYIIQICKKNNVPIKFS
jgi:serine protease Do